MLPTMLSAFLFAFIGAASVSIVPKQLMEFVVFFILIAMAIYTFTEKKPRLIQPKYTLRNKRDYIGNFFWRPYWFL